MNAEQRVPIVACTAEDVLWLEHCGGCFERFPAAEPRAAHEATCIAHRDMIVTEKLARQARDDGRNDEADELMEPYLL